MLASTSGLNGDEIFICIRFRLILTGTLRHDGLLPRRRTQLYRSDGPNTADRKPRSENKPTGTMTAPVAPPKRSGGYGRNIFPIVLDDSNPTV